MDEIRNKHKNSIKPSNLEAMRTKSIKVNKEQYACMIKMLMSNKADKEVYSLG